MTNKNASATTFADLSIGDMFEFVNPRSLEARRPLIGVLDAGPYTKMSARKYQHSSLLEGRDARFFRDPARGYAVGSPRAEVRVFSATGPSARFRDIAVGGLFRYGDPGKTYAKLSASSGVSLLAPRVHGYTTRFTAGDAVIREPARREWTLALMRLGIG